MSKLEELSQEHENIVCDYFKNRGWSCKKLDADNSKNREASDWYFSSGDISLLCEVKTIFSVRANIPYTPVQKIL